MRFLSILALSAMALTATAQNYTVNGSADSSLEGKKVYLIDQNTLTYSDSCVVENGKFAFSGDVKGDALYEMKAGRRRGKIYILVRPGSNVNVEVSSQAVKVEDVNGGMNNDLAAIESAVAEAGDKLNAKIRQYQAEGKSQTEMAAILEPEIEKIYDIYRKGIEDNKDNMVGAYILAMVAGQFYPSLGELDTMIGKVKYADKIAAIRTEREGLLKAEATQPGKMFVDFSGYTVDGAASKLSDYVGKGKYVLVDFWASWCGPCKGEIPNLIELQNKFGGDNFMVLGVNVWDEEVSFKAALTEEGITYPQIFIPRDNKDNATDMYGIKGIPQIILFGPDGTIIKRDLRGNAMKALVEETLK